jgi:transcriptional regulator with XRE-family HTH domain
MRRVDGRRIGRSLRAIRLRSGWRQVDVADKAKVSRAFVSKLERGLAATSDLERIERVCSALGADLDVRVRWRGEAIDRLLDEAHARLVEAFGRRLHDEGWEYAVEVTFNDYGERGSIDVFGWRPETRSLLVVEVKSIVVDAQGTLAPLDRKTRLAPKLARDRGWQPASVSRVLVVADGSTNRDRVARLGATFRAAFPDRGVAVSRWLRSPHGAISGLLFLRYDTAGGGTRPAAARQRVRRRKPGRIPPE